jgi:hypothetical protein
MLRSDQPAIAARLDRRRLLPCRTLGSFMTSTYARIARGSRRLAGLASMPLLLLVSLSGCGAIWSPSPPPPTPEEVEQMRQRLATQPLATESPGGRTDDDRSPSDLPTAAEPPPPVVRPLEPYPSWSMEDTAADSLGRIGAPAVPELIRRLDSPDPELRRRAAAVLGRIGPDAALAVPQLIRLLEDPHAPVRHTAARTLGQIGPRASAAVPALIERLD